MRVISILSALSACALSLALAGCTGDTEDPPAPNPNEPTPTTNQPSATSNKQAQQQQPQPATKDVKPQFEPTFPGDDPHDNP
jgi:hypothetical protein